MRVVVAEELTRALLGRHASLLSSADACWAFMARDGLVALDVLDDHRWNVGDFTMFDAADAGLARWAHDVAAAQSGSDAPLSAVERGVLAYGLQVRLRGATHARAMLERIRAHAGAPADALRLDVVASDPYLRDAFVSLPVVRAPTHVRLHADPGRSALLARLRERAVATPWLRSIELASPWRRSRDLGTRSTKRLAVFVFNQRSLDMVAPIRDELRSRGWDVTFFHYNPLAGRNPDAIEFGEAAKAAGGRSVIPSRRWSLDANIAAGAPVSARTVSRALDASWMTAMVQIERHRRVLEAWRPDVVASFGPDTMSLALQAAAREREIPSVFLPHGFLAPAPTIWSLVHATATAVPGWPCVEENFVDPFGERQDGLVVIGHPNYDELVRGRFDARDVGDTATLGTPPSRPHRVVLFAEWSNDLLGHVTQRRTLEMVAQALPHDAFLVCKLHPGREEREMCERVLGAMLDRDAFRVVSDRSFSTPGLLRVCEVAVASERSMSLSDAVVAGVPAIGIRHPENPLGTGDLNHPAKDYHEVCSVVTDVEELREAMIALTHDSVRRAQLLKRREAYIERFLFAADGGSSARAADLVEHLAAGGPASTFVPRARGRVPS